MMCHFCDYEDSLEQFRKANGCPACGYALDNFYAEPVKCNICNDEGHLSRSLYLQVFPERANEIPIEAIYVACDCFSDEEDANIIQWQQGQCKSEERQYYFYKYGNFTLTLLTSPQINTTRVEVYLENLRIYVSEKEISASEMTAELQDFLATVSEQLQTLSQIQFKD